MATIKQILEGWRDSIEESIAPRTLYLRRDVLNTEEIVTWFKDQGLEIDGSELHVTIAYSKNPVNWLKLGNGSDYVSGPSSMDHPLDVYPMGSMIVAPGPRTIERFGDNGQAVVMTFCSDTLNYRNSRVSDIGGTWDHPEYTPHVTLLKDLDNRVDTSTIKPFLNPIILGPEIFEELPKQVPTRTVGYIEQAKGTASAIYTLEVSDYDQALLKLLNFLKKCGDEGHSVSFQIDDERFGFDGDGSDKIVDITVEKKEAACDENRGSDKEIDPEAKYVVQPDKTWKKAGKKVDRRSKPVKGRNLPKGAEISNVSRAAIHCSVMWDILSKNK